MNTMIHIKIITYTLPWLVTVHGVIMNNEPTKTKEHSSTTIKAVAELKSIKLQCIINKINTPKFITILQYLKLIISNIKYVDST